MRFPFVGVTCLFSCCCAEEIEPLLVVGDRVEERGIHVPGNNAIVSRDLIERSGATGVSDLLETHAGKESKC